MSKGSRPAPSGSTNRATATKNAIIRLVQRFVIDWRCTASAVKFGVRVAQRLGEDHTSVSAQRRRVVGRDALERADDREQLVHVLARQRRNRQTRLLRAGCIDHV